MKTLKERMKEKYIELLSSMAEGKDYKTLFTEFEDGLYWLIGEYISSDLCDVCECKIKPTGIMMTGQPPIKYEWKCSHCGKVEYRKEEK